MHDVLDPRDLVPDGAEQLTLRGYSAEGLLADARDAAAADDLDGVWTMRQSGADRDAALDHVDAELRACAWVHTINNNAPLIAVGLLWGEHITDAVALTHERLRSAIRGFDTITVGKLAERTVRLVAAGRH